MSKPQRDRSGETAPPGIALSASVRRHLGQNLRTLYADSLSAPVSQRLEALLAQLDRPKR